MSIRIYISADYDPDSGDRNVVEALDKWNEDGRYVLDYSDMAKVVSGSVSKDPDCRICELKEEFNTQINLSSAVIFIVGDKTKTRTAGNSCERNTKEQHECYCTPYKQNAGGAKLCKVISTTDVGPADNVGCINRYSYLYHEYLQAIKKSKTIIVVYNSLYKQPSWLPWYLESYKDKAVPFWIRNESGDKVGYYAFIKKALGYE